MQITKINRNADLYNDRLMELKHFYKLSPLFLFIHYLRNGTPNTKYYKERLMHHFDVVQKSNANDLLRAYNNADLMYSNRLMLRYHNYKIGDKALELIRNCFSSTSNDNIKVLDYGCGVADPSIFLSLHGVKSTIVDLDTKKLQFAKYRFECRKLDANVIVVTQPQVPVSLDSNKKYHLIIMAEFLEHTYSPKTFLDFALSHLVSGGILYDSLGPIHKHGVAGDHLEEAKKEMESTDYKNYFNKYLAPINSKYGLDKYCHFYIKK